MAHIENNISQEQSYQISLNSVSESYPDGNGGFTHDFTGNNLWETHTTGEVKRKSLTTQPELSDEEIYAQPVESQQSEEEGEGEGEGGNNPQEPQQNGGGNDPQSETPSGDQPSNP